MIFKLINDKNEETKELKKWIREWVDLSTVDISDLDSLEWAFSNVKQYTRSITNWNTSNIKNMSYCFQNVENFNEDISNWDTSKVENMR